MPHRCSKLYEGFVVVIVFGGDLQQLAGAMMEKVAETFRGQPETEGGGKSGREESFSYDTAGAAALVIGAVVDNGVMAGSSSPPATGLPSTSRWLMRMVQAEERTPG